MTTTVEKCRRCGLLGHILCTGRVPANRWIRLYVFARPPA